MGNFGGEVWFFNNLDDGQKVVIDSGNPQLCKSLAFGTDIITDFVSLAVGYSDKVKVFKFEDD